MFTVICLLLSLLLIYNRRLPNNWRWILLSAFFLSSALFFLQEAAPSLAARHTDGQMFIGCEMFVIYAILLIVAFARKRTLNIKLSLAVMLVWSLVIEVIGWNTPCPVCGIYWYYELLAKYGLMNYPPC